MKKLLCALLALCLAGFCACAQEADTILSGSYEYVLLEDGAAEIRGYFGPGGDVEIPTMLDGHPVRGIGECAFDMHFGVKSATVPEGVTYLAESAFYCCLGMERVSLPDSLTRIDGNPFTECESLKTIEISPDHPAFTVSDGVLFGKEDRRLIHYPETWEETTYTVPEGTLKIADSAFYCCPGMTEITLPEGVTEIGTYAFGWCDGLRSVNIPDSVTKMGANPFAASLNMTDLRIDPEHPALAYRDGLLIDREGRRLIACLSAAEGSSYAVPEGVLEIGQRAFFGRTELAGIAIPDGVVRIGACAFENCWNLKEVVIPESVTEIGEYAFYGCEGLTSVEIPDSVTFIGEDAFMDCWELTARVRRRSCAHIYCEENGIPYVLMEDAADAGSENAGREVWTWVLDGGVWTQGWAKADEAEGAPEGFAAALGSVPAGYEVDVTDAEASDFLIESYGSSSIYYDPYNLLNDDDTKPWVVHGDEGWVELSWDGDEDVTGFTIRNGFQQTSKIYYGNYRPRTLDVYVGGMLLCSVELADEMGTQYVAFSQSVRGGSIRFEVADVYPTNIDEDMCIGSIHVFAQ